MVKNKQTYIWLFGGGGAATYLIDGIQREGIVLDGVLDDSVHCDGSGIKGLNAVPVLSPNSFKLTPEIKENSIVIMGILNPLINTILIKDRLIAEGWADVQDFDKWVENQYMKTKKCPAPISAKDWVGKSYELQQVRNGLADEESIKIFDAFLKFVEEGKNEFPPINTQPYFPNDIPKMEFPLKMIDCGAFTGDTILQAQSLGYLLETVHAFEPDCINYKKLSIVAKDINDIVCWPVGVGGNTETIRFQNQGDMGSFAYSDGNTMIQCVALDDCLPNFSVNLIKMDIEGSEFDALKGAEQLLRKYRPRLAISVYHLSGDIWKIPLWIRQVYGETAKFYLRHHSRTIADTVLYVLP